ncbi:hypothetical protein F53441_8887 [Fusarium austroafricanum]|uniref:Nucleoside phosphorylase domain-containing protein n=1 Tax=Fusarium austroafricanum TaxID=2364996 RepID=A0A8H4KAB1_9HYPO|nr:hypothetical protein F53441_8887 [Fusarium austroafricanum]
MQPPANRKDFRVAIVYPNMGTTSAAAATASLQSSYTGLKLAILVGICGGVPNIANFNALLGDVASAVRVDAGSTYWRDGVFYQQLFAKGPRSEYFKVARGHDLASLDAKQARKEMAIQQAMEVFQAKSKEARKKEIEVIEEMGALAAPNSWLRRLGSTAHLKDFSDKKRFLRDLISWKYVLKPDDPKDDSELRHIHAADV